MTLSPAASGAASAVTQTEWTALTQDLGDAAFEGSFTLTDSRIMATSLVIIQPAALPAPREDEATMDPLFCVAVPDAGSALVYWTTMGQGRVSGDKAFFYTVG